MKDFFMNHALNLAKKAFDLNEVPVGAIIVKNNEIVSSGFNNREKVKNALGHAEIMAINNACKKIKSWRLVGCDIYVTLEPCLMCAGAIINSRIDKIFFGAFDFKNGVAGSVVNIFEFSFTHKLKSVIGGIKQKESSELLSDFFKKIR